METDIDKVIEHAKTEAQEIIASTGHVRASYAAGRPNSSPKSTAKGTLKAMKIIVDNHTPTGFTRREQ
jgi:hypothetical protein